MFLSKVKFAGLALLALAVVASGAGWLANRSASPRLQAAAPPPPPARPAEKPENPARPKDKDAKAALPQPASAAEIGKALAAPVDFPGIDDPKTTLAEALDLLAKKYKVQFEINEKAFKEQNIEDIGAAKVGLRPISPMKAPLRTVLRKLLSRLPDIPDAVLFLIRKDHVEILPENAVRTELRIPLTIPEAINPLAGGIGIGGIGGIGALIDQRLPVLVWEDFRKTPVAQAFNALAESADCNIVIDPRVEVKTSIMATARLANVLVDTAIQVLADMAGLDVVRMDNVFYVTSVENAVRLRGARKRAVPAEHLLGGPIPANPAKKGS